MQRIVFAVTVLILMSGARVASASCVCESYDEADFFCGSTDIDGTQCCEVCDGAGDTLTCDECDTLAEPSDDGGCAAGGRTPDGVVWLLGMALVGAFFRSKKGKKLG